MAASDFRRWIDEGGEPLDARMCADLVAPEEPEREDPLAQPHPREEMTYERISRWSHTRGERLLRGIYCAVAVLVCVGLSALLTTTMPALRDAVALLNQQDFRKDIKVMVGGAPITQAFADEIGADAYTPDAASAAIKAKELVG